MATDDALSAYAADLADLDKVTARLKRARAHVADLEGEAEKAVAKALHSCIAAGQNRTEVQKHSPFSPPKVRGIGEAAGIPPDERYVRTSAPRNLGLGSVGIGDTAEEAITNSGPSTMAKTCARSSGPPPSSAAPSLSSGSGPSMPTGTGRCRTW